MPRVATETIYVSTGTTLLEDRNGVSFGRDVSSIDSRPARLTVNRDGRNDYLYVHDGRGVSPASSTRRSERIAERYGYESPGIPTSRRSTAWPFDLPARKATASSL